MDSMLVGWTTADYVSYTCFAYVVYRVITHNSVPTFGSDDGKREHFLRWRTGVFYVPFLACASLNNPEILQCFIYLLCVVGMGEYCHIVVPMRLPSSVPVGSNSPASARPTCSPATAEEKAKAKGSDEDEDEGDKPEKSAAAPAPAVTYSTYKLSKMDRVVQGFALLFCFAMLRGFVCFAVTVGLVFCIFVCGLLLKLIHSNRPLTPDMFYLLGVYWLGLFWIAFPLAHTPILAYGVVIDGYRYGGIVFILLLITSWIGDAAAYYVGKNFGKHRAMPNISPKKSVEGCVGLIVFCSLWCGGLSYLQQTNPTFSFLPPFTTVEYMTLGLLLGVFGIFGDALESFIKRVGGVKDSGTFFPGHGGVLDRFDALFLAGLPAYYYLSIFVTGELVV